jgi:isopenicillin N synthase-like dioxygenase
LPTIDYELLLSGNPLEKQKLWEAATTLGFWYLKNHGADSLIKSMFDIGKETLKLDFEEKMKFWQGDSGGSFGYKAAGATYVDLKGSKDVAEFINIAKDDALAFPMVQHQKYPDTINTHMETVVKPFVSGCVEVTQTLIEVFNEFLDLPTGTLGRLHSTEVPSISEARCIKVPVISQTDEDKIALGAHTDFGSLSFLINEIGGLQVLPRGDTVWKYVVPRQGHAICNIGDALNLLSGGILKSCVHRVVPPPGSQSKYERWSLVYFSRPGNSTVLNALEDKSNIIAESVYKSDDPSIYRPGATAKDWFYRRQSKWRTDNKTRVEAYLESRGTEHIKAAV